MAMGFLGEGAHRRVACVSHAGGDRTNVARDIGIGFAPRVDQRVEIAREAGIGGGETDHADACSTARRNASTSGTTRSRVLKAARLTTRRLLTWAIVSTSTSPFSLSVRPDETRSTMRGARPSVGANSIAPFSLTNSAWTPRASKQVRVA